MINPLLPAAAVQLSLGQDQRPLREGGREGAREAASPQRLQLEGWSQVSPEGSEEGEGRKDEPTTGAAPELRAKGAKREVW